MDYIENIEPIHEMLTEDLEHILDLMKEDLEILWTHKDMDPQKTKKFIEYQVDFNLNTLIHSLKKSLLYFHPEHEKKLLGVVNADKAMWFKRLLPEYCIISTPLYEDIYEGIDALIKIYLQLGPHYPCRQEDLETAYFDFERMCDAVKKYTYIAEKEYLRKQAKEGSAKGGKHPKRLKGILLAVEKILTDGRHEYSAEQLFRVIADKHKGEKNSIRVKKYQIYFVENQKDDRPRLYQITPNGKRDSIGRSAFSGYVKQVKESLKKIKQSLK